MVQVRIYPHDSVINDATVLHIVQVAVLDGGDEISGGTTIGTDSGHEPLHLQRLRKTTGLKKTTPKTEIENTISVSD